MYGFKCLGAPLAQDPHCVDDGIDISETRRPGLGIAISGEIRFDVSNTGMTAAFGAHVSNCANHLVSGGDEGFQQMSPDEACRASEQYDHEVNYSSVS